MARAGDVLENPNTGERIVFRKTALETNGELLRFDFFVAPGGFAPPRHVHAQVEERIELETGRLGYYVDGKEGALAPGESIILPVGVAHTFWNSDDEMAHSIIEVRPALNMETFFETIFGLYQDGKTNKRGVPNILQAIVLAREYDGFLAGPPIPVQRAFLIAVAPFARLLGYRALYPKYSRLSET